MHIRHQPSKQPHQLEVDRQTAIARDPAADVPSEPIVVQTACGQLWQQWQAPAVFADGQLGVLPGPADPPDGEPFDCTACADELTHWRDGQGDEPAVVRED